MERLKQADNFSGNPFGRSYKARLEAMAREVNEFTRLKQRLIKMLAMVESLPPMIFGTHALIEGHEPLPDTDGRFKYAWREIRLDDTGLAVESIAGTHRFGTLATDFAINLWEAMNNDMSSTLGLDLVDPQVTIEITPIPLGAPVFVFLMPYTAATVEGQPLPEPKPRWVFYAPNEPEVTCKNTPTEPNVEPKVGF
jgi:hypothetical protein